MRGKKARTVGFVLATLALSGLAACSTTYEVSYVANSPTVDIRTAQQTLRTVLTGREVDSSASGTRRVYQIKDVRMRQDGVGVLWAEARDTGVLAEKLAYDGPQSLHLCYYSQIKQARVILVKAPVGNPFYYVYLCDVGVWFFSKDGAEEFADVVFALKYNSR